MASCWLVFQWGRYPNIYSFGITWGNVDPDLWLHADLLFSEWGIQIFFIWCYLRRWWSKSMASWWLVFQWGRYPNTYSFGVTWGNIDPDLWLHGDLLFSEGGIPIFIHLVLPEAMLIQIYGFMLTCFSVREVSKYLFIWYYLRQCWSRSMASCWLGFQWGRYPNIYSFGATWGNVDPDLWLHADLLFSEWGIQIFIHLVLPAAMLIQIYGLMLTLFSVREVSKIFIHLVLLFKHQSSKCSLHLSVLSTQMLWFHWWLYSNHQQSLSSCNRWSESKS